MQQYQILLKTIYATTLYYFHSLKIEMKDYYVSHLVYLVLDKNGIPQKLIRCQNCNIHNNAGMKYLSN